MAHAINEAPGPDAAEVLDEASEVVVAICGFVPRRLERLKGGKSDVFRVVGPPGQPDLVVKRSGSETIRVESQVLDWLALAPFPTVQGFGTAPASTLGRSWLVSQFAEGASYDSRRPDHQDHAGAWLADLHAWSRQVPVPSLPERGASYHEAVMLDACSTLETALVLGSSLAAKERADIEILARLGRRTLDRWQQVRELLEEPPRALVHSGIAGKNVRISGTAVLAFDWEQAGWGCPAADVSAVGLDAYVRRLGAHGLDIRRPAAVAAVGTILWCFAGIPGERENLLGPWPHRAAGKMPYYLEAVRSVLPALSAGGIR